MNCNEIGLRPDESLESIWPDSTVDLSLRTRQPVTDLERTAAGRDFADRRLVPTPGRSRFGHWADWVSFSGGIGPDGHIGFNVRGSDHFSTTRLMATNYETQAAAAGDLGGIEVSRRRLVITIGLGTITCNRDCTAIIIAAGEAKAACDRRRGTE